MDMPIPPASDDVQAEIGRKLKAARQAKGMTLKVLGRSIGCSHQQVQKYEIGRNAMTAEKLMAIADALGIGLNDLLPERERQAKRDPKARFRLVLGDLNGVLAEMDQAERIGAVAEAMGEMARVIRRKG